jgi:hypothetical protein
MQMQLHSRKATASAVGPRFCTPLGSVGGGLGVLDMMMITMMMMMNEDEDDDDDDDAWHDGWRQ